MLVKVLLISPKDPDVPSDLKLLMGGENTYTRTLLENPPKGVEYIHYSQAQKEGLIRRTLPGKLISLLMTVRIWPPDAGILSFKLNTRFDLVHCHSYSLKLTGFTCPIVLSDSSSNFLFLRDYLGWGIIRINFLYKIRKFISRTFGLYDPNFNLMSSFLVVWSGFAKRIHADLGIDPNIIKVIPPGIKSMKNKKVTHEGFNVLFVGIWFERKGGPQIVEAYRVLKKKYSNLNLFVVSQLPDGFRLPPEVWHKEHVSRDELLNDIYPRCDLLVLVPPVAEGYGLVVLEAASFGIPSIVSSVYALPEIVEDGKTGFVIKSQGQALQEKLEFLINNPDQVRKMGKLAREKFEKEFNVAETNKKLLRIYREAIGK